jgi:rhodanese-related sulfurtransferase
MKQATQNLEISSEQLSAYLKQQVPLLLFDLRDKENFEKHHIKGSVHAVCNTQAKEKIMPKIPNLD